MPGRANEHEIRSGTDTKRWTYTEVASKSRVRESICWIHKIASAPFPRSTFKKISALGSRSYMILSLSRAKQQTIYWKTNDGIITKISARWSAHLRYIFRCTFFYCIHNFFNSNPTNKIIMKIITIKKDTHTQTHTNSHLIDKSIEN